MSHGQRGNDPNPFDDYRSADNPMVRLFSTYGRADIHLFVIGVVASVLARGVALVPPLVLGVAINAVFNGDTRSGCRWSRQGGCQRPPPVSSGCARDSCSGRRSSGLFSAGLRV